MAAFRVEAEARRLRLADVASLGREATAWDDMPEKNRQTYRRLAERELARGSEAAPTTAPLPARTPTSEDRTMTDTSDTTPEAAPDAAAPAVLPPNGIVDPELSVPSATEAQAIAAMEERARIVAEEPAAAEVPSGSLSIEQVTEALVILAGAVSMQRISAKVRAAVAAIPTWPRLGSTDDDGPAPIDAPAVVIDARSALGAGLADQLRRAERMDIIRLREVVTEELALGHPLPEPYWEPADLVAPGQPLEFGALAHRDEQAIRPEVAAMLGEPAAAGVPTMEQMVARGVSALAAAYGPADDWAIMASTVLAAVKELVNGR